MEYILTTSRIGLRRWRASDHQPFSEMNHQMSVMRYFPALLSPEDSRLAIQRFNQHLDETGYTYFAAEERVTGRWIGFVGLLNRKYPIDCSASVDLGWRLIPDVWGHGLAVEAARACIQYAADLGIQELVAVASHRNQPSIRVMEKLGMARGGEFEHPAIPKASLLNPCVYYLTSSQSCENRPLEARP